MLALLLICIPVNAMLCRVTPALTTVERHFHAKQMVVHCDVDVNETNLKTLLRGCPLTRIIATVAVTQFDSDSAVLCSDVATTGCILVSPVTGCVHISIIAVIEFTASVQRVPTPPGTVVSLCSLKNQLRLG